MKPSAQNVTGLHSIIIQLLEEKVKYKYYNKLQHCKMLNKYVKQSKKTAKNIKKMPKNVEIKLNIL